MVANLEVLVLYLEVATPEVTVKPTPCRDGRTARYPRSAADGAR
jgi:hypothetical protein